MSEISIFHEVIMKIDSKTTAGYEYQEYGRVSFRERTCRILSWRPSLAGAVPSWREVRPESPTRSSGEKLKIVLEVAVSSLVQNRVSFPVREHSIIPVMDVAECSPENIPIS